MSLPLSRAVELLARLAPLEHAEDWDNVGLLVGLPQDAPRAAAITRVLFAIDLTEAVLEALARQVELVVAYHPPIFSPLRKLDGRGTSRLLLRAAASGVAVYSPHTALDASPEGVNDWLAAGVGSGTTAPLVDAARIDASAELKLVTFVPPEHAAPLRAAMRPAPPWGRAAVSRR
jgi:putative NIF3 family GTP cyclohydrolase 1 type 2